MKPYLLPITVGFQAVSLVHFMVRGDLSSIAAFACASLLCAFFTFLEKEQVHDRQSVENRMLKIESALQNLAVKMESW